MLISRKWCPKCQRDKLLSAFGLNRQRKDGIAVYCMACRAAYQRQRRKDGHEPWKRERYTKHPALFKAHVYVYRALKSGQLVKPALCPKCKTAGRRVEGHHPRGYSKKHQLDVEWMCRSCHILTHKRATRPLRQRAAG